MRCRILVSAAVLAIGLACAPSTFALTVNITTPTNWSTAGIGPADTVNVQGATARLNVDVGNAQCTTLNVGTATGAGILAFVSGSKLTASGTFNLGNSSGAGTLDMSLGGTLTTPGIVDSNFASFVPGSGTIVVTGSVPLPSSAAFATYNILNIANGTVTVQQTTSAATLQLGTAIGGASGTLDLKGKNVTTSTISILGGGGNTITDSTAQATFTVNIPAGTVSYGGFLTGNNLILAKDGLGTLVVSGGPGNTYGTGTGGTTVINGTLQLGAANSISTTGGLTLGSGTFSGTFDLNGLNQSVSSVATNGTGTLNTVTNSSGTAQFSITAGGVYNGAITGSGLSVNLNTSGGQVTLSGTNNTYSGNTNILNGTLKLGAANTLPQSTTVMLGSGTNNTTLDLNGNNQAVAGIGTNGTGIATVTNNAGAGAATLTVGSVQGSVPQSTFGGKILTGGFAALNLAVDAGTTLTLTGNANTFANLTVINGTLKVGNPNALPAVPVPTILGGGTTPGTLDINGNNVTIGSLSTGGSSTNSMVRDSTSPSPQMAKTLTTQFNGPFVYNGQCTAVLAKDGAGTLTVSQPGAFSVINVLNGTVLCSGANIFGGSSSLTLGNGSNSGVFDLGGFSQNVGTIGTSGSGGVNNKIQSTGGTPTLTIQNSQPASPFSFNGTIKDAISLAILTTNDSPFTFSGTGTYTGSTTISQGPVAVTGTANSSAFTVSGAGGPLSGTGSVGTITALSGDTVSPGGGSVGTLFATSANLGSGTLQIRIPSNAGADQLNCSSALTLNGTSQLVLDLIGYGPGLPASSFTIAHGGGNITGTFSSFVVLHNTSGYAVDISYTATDVTAIVGALPVVAPNAFPAATAGNNFNYNIIASESPSSYGASGLPPGLSLIGNQIRGTPTTAGSYPITLNASNKAGTGPNVIMTLNVSPGAFTKLQALLPGESAAPGTPSGKTGFPSAQTAGVSFNVTINAVDSNWNLVNSVTDNVTITSNDSTFVAASGTLAGGTKVIPVTVTAASPPPAGPPTTLTASDTTNIARLPYTTGNLTVNPAAYAQLQLLVPGENALPGSVSGKTGAPIQEQATNGFPVQINAVDAFWNVINTVTDTVTFTSTDPLAALPPSAVLVNGSKSAGITLNLGPTQKITALTSNINIAQDTSPSISVRPGPYVKLQVLAPGETNAPGTGSGKTGAPLSQTGGTPFSVTVNAVDNFFTIVPNINDVVHIASSDTGAILPADASLAAGTQTFNVTLVTGPAQTVRANDISDPSKFSPPSSSITVNTILATLTAISPDAGVLNGPAFTLTVTGTNFIASSVIQWNGATQPTTFVSATQLTAAIPAALLATAGRANVTVFTPPPGTGSTAAIPFFVYSGTSTATWIVTNTNDAGQGSLRFAMSQMRKGDTVIFDSNVFDLTSADAATVINVLSALPVINQGNIKIDAQDRRVSVNGAGAGSAPGLEITSANNTIFGLSIVGFTQSGIQIHSGAQNNVIGGSRLTGAGPNGQGLRLSDNGSYGLEIDDSGTTGNVVKGCWIGLDSAGTSAEPNLAGIIIQNGAQQNTIGGTGNGEANVISGNKFEGITVTGTGTDNNTILGNVVGMSGVTVSSRDSEFGTRSSVGNGSAGVFLSKGTQGSTVGGDTDAEGNLIGSNGGNGVEVRAKTSKHNKSKGNRITGNARGGIALFDGSNDGIQAPTINAAIGTRSAPVIVNGRALSATHITGTAASEGTVEVFSDTGSQGSTIIGRSNVIASQWAVDANVDTTLNITATFTDTNGNTSPFAVYSPSANAGALGNLPTDLQTTLSALTSDPTTTLFGGQPPAAPSTLTLNSLAIKLNLASTGSDLITAGGSLPVPSGFTFSGQVMVVDVGGVAKLVTLDSKGSSTGALVMKFAKAKNGSSKFTAKFAKGAYAATLSTTGLGSTSGTVALPVYVVFNKIVYAATPSVTYTVKAGKSGTVKFTQK